MAAQANEGPRNPEEWLERLSEVVSDVEEQRELKNKFCQIREATITELTKVKDRLLAINDGKKIAAFKLAYTGGTIIGFISNLLAVTGELYSLTGLVKINVCKWMAENAETVRSILEEDADSSMALMKSLIRLEELKTLVEEVMGFGMFTTMVNFFKRRQNVNEEEVNADLPPQIYYFIRSSSLSKSSKAKVEEWMTAIYRSLPSRNSFLSVMGMCKNIDLADTKQTYDDLRVLKAKFLETNPTLSLLKTNYDYRTREVILNAGDVLSLCNQYLSISETCRDVDVDCKFITMFGKYTSLLQEELNIIKSLNLD